MTYNSDYKSFAHDPEQMTAGDPELIYIISPGFPMVYRYRVQSPSLLFIAVTVE